MLLLIAVQHRRIDDAISMKISATIITFNEERNIAAGDREPALLR